MLRLFPLIFAILLIGCSQKQYNSSQNFLITIKTKEFKFSDIGIISKGDNSVRVNIFSVGHQVLKLEMDNFISVNGGVPTPYLAFNMRYLNSKYPSETIKEIFLGKPIFSGKNLKREKNGFSQKIENIIYKVSKEQIYFKDLTEKILIKIKRLI